MEKIKREKEEIENLKNQVREKLERISGIKKEEAKKEILKEVEEEIKKEAIERIRKLEKEGRREVSKKGKGNFGKRNPEIDSPSSSRDDYLYCHFAK